MAERPKEPESKEASGAGGGEAQPPESAWTALFKELGRKVLTGLLTLGGLTAFAAFAGSIVLWTRFDALQLPAEQIVTAIPRAEAVTTGTTILLLFGFCGAIAALAVYLIDRGGRATPGMSQGVVAIVAVEALAAIWLVDGSELVRKGIATEVVLIAFAAIVWTTHVGGLVNLKPPDGEDDELPDLFGDEPVQPPEPGAFRDSDNKWDGRRHLPWLIAGALAAGVEAGLIACLVFDLGAGWGWFVGLGSAGAVLLAAVLVGWAAFVRRDAAGTRPAPERKSREKPPAAELTPAGAVVIVGLAVAAAVAPIVVLGELWLGVTLAVAMILGLGLWRIADLSSGRFALYGIAVFLSVPLFGTVALASRNLDDPQAQPLAIIRGGDGPAEALQGLYVAETDDRVYFANVATKACGKKIVGDSGRLLWVPRSEVVAMAVGPQQDIEKAARASLEMAYALTPDVETPEGGHVSLVAEGEPGEGDDAEEDAKKQDGVDAEERLVDAGPAVRPTFGRGLRLEPATAKPGQTVRLVLPTPEYGGFSDFSEEGSLRLNGDKLTILNRSFTGTGDDEGRSFPPEKVIEFKVPEGATSGIVSIECTQLAGQPYLTVPQKPVGRIAVRMQTGSRRVVFDSGKSSDDSDEGEKLLRTWTIAGLRRGHGTSVGADLPPRLAPYHVRLELTDSEGKTDRVDLKLLRLPQSRFPFGADRPDDSTVVEHVREALRRTLKTLKQRNLAAIEIDGHADSVGTAGFNFGLSMRRARWIRHRLFVLHDRDAPASGPSPLTNPRDRPVPLVIRAFGESCPIVRKPGAQPINRRVEVFLLGPGASVATPESCRAGRFRRMNW